MEKMKDIARYAAVLLAGAAAGVLLYMGVRREPSRPDVVVGTDTLVVTRIDTVVRIKPRPYKVEVTDTVFIYDNDSTIALPVEVNYYDDSLYHAQVSGYHPSLDYIEVYPRTITKTIHTASTVTRDVPVHPRWAIGLSAGYGACLVSGQPALSPYVGVGITYIITSW